MAIRNIRSDRDEVLRKISKEVEKIDTRILTLLKDMAETMYKANGVGLAAPQIGVLKRTLVIDVGDGLIVEILLRTGTKKDTISTRNGDHIGWSFFVPSTLDRNQNGNHLK